MNKVKKSFNKTLVEYYDQLPLYLGDKECINYRKLSELPWQLVKTGQYSRLSNLLEFQISFWVEKAILTNQSVFETYNYWKNLAKRVNIPYNLVQETFSKEIYLTENEATFKTIKIKGIPEPIKRFNFDGISFLCATDFNVYSIFSKDLEIRQIIKRTDNKIIDICKDDGSSVVAIALENGYLEIYDYLLGTKLFILKSFSIDKNFNLIFTKKLTAYFASGGKSKEFSILSVWDIVTGRKLKEINFRMTFNCIVLTPKGEVIFIDQNKKWVNISKML